VYVSYHARIILDLTDLETGDEEEADISKFVRHHVGRITKQRVERFERTMPAQVKVINGCVAEADMEAWLERFRACKSTIAKSM